MANKSGVPGAIRRQLFRAANYTCEKCGLVGYEKRHKSKRGHVSYTFPTLKTGVYLSVDHEIPRALGGTNDIKNLRCWCTDCNTRKGIRLDA